MTKAALPRPVAFMVMPFGTKRVAVARPDAPRQVDFDALWDRVYQPVLANLGYLAIRADAEKGSVIVKDMLLRLALSDLVVADLTLPNGNVYYEVGLRHVARRTHCVLTAAKWSEQLFDLDQIRADRFPLRDGSVPEEEAAGIRSLVRAAIEAKRDVLTPWHELVHDSVAEESAFREQVETIGAFQARVRSIRALQDESVRTAEVRRLLDSLEAASLELPEVAFEVISLVRDALEWHDLLTYVAQLPPAVQNRSWVREQALLAQSEMGDHVAAIEGLRQLIELRGDTAERRGLIGGRSKRLWREARKQREAAGKTEPSLEEQAHLDSAIASYTLGMELDYNEYYCASNLPGLLRARGGEGDEDEARFLGRLVVRLCERKLRRGEDDGWVKPTLLLAAFQAADLDKVRALLVDVARQGPATWQVRSVLADIADAIAHVEDAETRAALEEQRRRLEELAPSPQ